MKRYKLWWRYKLTNREHRGELPTVLRGFLAESDETAAKIARKIVNKARASLNKRHVRYTNFMSSLVRWTEVQVQF